MVVLNPPHVMNVRDKCTVLCKLIFFVFAPTDHKRAFFQGMEGEKRKRREGKEKGQKKKQSPHKLRKKGQKTKLCTTHSIETKPPCDRCEDHHRSEEVEEQGAGGQRRGEAKDHHPSNTAHHVLQRRRMTCLRGRREGGREKGSPPFERPPLSTESLYCMDTEGRERKGRKGGRERDIVPAHTVHTARPLLPH